LNIKTKKGWPWDEKEYLAKNLNKDINYPKISIITPSYNQGKFIEETIRSVLLQNYPNLEYIIIDGGSTDESVEIIKKYAPWITYWVSEPDNGQTHAINKGFKKATGEITNWLNSDDVLCPNALFHIANKFMEDEKIQFVFGDLIVFDDNNNRGEKEVSYNASRKFDNLNIRALFSFPYGQPASYYKRSLFEEIGYLDESFNFTMDVDFFVRIALNHEMHQIPDFICKFRLHSESKTCTIGDVREREYCKVFSKILRSFPFTKTWIDDMRRLGYYEEGQAFYKPISFSFKKEDIHYAFANLMVRMGMNAYNEKDFKKAVEIIDYVKKSNPKVFKEHNLARLSTRARILTYSIPNKLYQAVKRQ